MDNRFATDPDDADALSAFWDAVARGMPDPPSAGLDPDTVALVRRVRRAARAGDPPDSRDRALTAVMRELAGHGVRPNDHERRSAVSTTTILPPPPTAANANGWTDPRHGRPASLMIPIALRHRLGWAVSLAAATVLLLALAGGLVAIRSGMSGSDDGHFSSIMAPQVSPEATPPAGPVAFLWETRGDPDDPLGNPAFLAVAPDGAIWVADGDHDRFLIFAPDGSLLETWGESGSGEGKFDFTTQGWGGYDHGAIAFAPDSGFYVADPGNFRIQRFGPDRRFLTAWGSEGTEPGQFRTANDLVVDGQGRVYVLDTSRYFTPAVQVFDADGRFLSAWGELGSKPGQLNAPSGIGFDPNGTLLIAEFSGNRVQRFSPEGELLDEWGGAGTDDGEFNYAHDAAVDADGRVFVSDYANHRVQVFDRDGRFLAAWGENGTEAGEFAYALGLAVGSDGAVYVADEAKRLQAFQVLSLPEPAATPRAGHAGPREAHSTVPSDRAIPRL